MHARGGVRGNGRRSSVPPLGPLPDHGGVPTPDHAPARPGLGKRILAAGGRCGLWTAAVIGWLWSLGALWWFAPWPPMARQFAVGMWMCRLATMAQRSR